MAEKRCFIFYLGHHEQTTDTQRSGAAEAESGAADEPSSQPSAPPSQENVGTRPPQATGRTERASTLLDPNLTSQQPDATHPPPRQPVPQQLRASLQTPAPHTPTTQMSTITASRPTQTKATCHPRSAATSTTSASSAARNPHAPHVMTSMSSTSFASRTPPELFQRALPMTFTSAEQGPTPVMRPPPPPPPPVLFMTTSAPHPCASQTPASNRTPVMRPLHPAALTGATAAANQHTRSSFPTQTLQPTACRPPHMTSQFQRTPQTTNQSTLWPATTTTNAQHPTATPMMSATMRQHPQQTPMSFPAAERTSSQHPPAFHQTQTVTRFQTPPTAIVATPLSISSPPPTTWRPTSSTPTSVRPRAPHFSRRIGRSRPIWSSLHPWCRRRRPLRPPLLPF